MRSAHVAHVMPSTSNMMLSVSLTLFADQLVTT